MKWLAASRFMDWLGISIAGLLSALAYIFGGQRDLIAALVIFMVIDYLTGVWAAYESKRLCSQIMFRGIVHKTLRFALVAMAVQLDRLMSMNPPLLTIIVIWFLIANEGLSAIENLARAGVPIPERLRSALIGLRTTAEDG